MRDPVRARAVQLLLQVEEGIPLSGPMEQAEAQLDSVARPRLRSLVSSTLRNRSRLDAVLQQFLRKTKVRKLHPPLRQILRLGASELLFEDKPRAVVVDAWVGEAGRFGHRGTRGLSNAVLRRVADSGPAAWVEVLERREGSERLALEFSHPLPLVESWSSDFGEAGCRGILEWNQQPPVSSVRIRPGMVDPPGEPTWIPESRRLPERVRAAELPGFRDGDFTIQDGSGTLVGHLPPNVEGTIIDVCSAPGAKTGHLLERAKPGTRLVAADLSSGRLRRLKAGLARAGVEEGIALQRVAADGSCPAWVPGVDGVLIDAPCSNLGVVRRRPDVRWRVRKEEVDRLAQVQRKLLAASAATVAPGGWLVYSVCTIEPQETWNQREWFLEEHSGWSPLPVPEWVPETVRRNEGETFLLPGEHETDGGYAFVMRRDSR